MSISSKAKRKAKKAIKKALPKSTVKKIKKQRFQARIHEKVYKLTPSTYQSDTHYTVVTAVYNAAPYLDDFFSSLYNQTLNRNNIHIIAVDDGSTDNSAELIREWQAKWPQAITYLHKENGGQASARNLGLEYVNTEWITFTDPDDFVSRDYFEVVDIFCKRAKGLQLIACNLIFFHEGTKVFTNTHALRSKFIQEENIYSIRDNNVPTQLSMSSAFFRKSIINNNNLLIDETIKPNFEDGHFIGKYLLSLQQGEIAFLKNAHYYYRKRAASTSTLDSSWKKLDRFLNVPKKGYLDLLERAYSLNDGRIPAYIQHMVLYDVSWYFKYLTGHPEYVVFEKDSSEEAEFFNTFEKIFNLLDRDVIHSVSPKYLPYKYKLGISHLSKHEAPSKTIVHIKKIDFKRSAILFESYIPGIIFKANGNPLKIITQKQVTADFCYRPLFHYYETWCEIDLNAKELEIRTPHNEKVSLNITNKWLSGSTFNLDKLKDIYTKHWDKYPTVGDAWIITDINYQADDNGEHFYRYLMNEHPEQQCIFVLSKSSPDWNRLKREGFNLVDFDSKKFDKEIKRASKLISSHADGCFYSHFGDNFYRSKDFVFLQHGVVKENISSWFNNLPLDMLVCSSPYEYESIAHGETYFASNYNTVLTGLPRHDTLLERAGKESTQKTILIAPTWRKSLMGNHVPEKAQWALNDDFPRSKYSRYWQALLQDPKLEAFAKANNLEIVFFPHHNILPYAESGLFPIPSYVRLGSAKEASIQDYFLEAAVSITDYSSVVFDVAYLNKPVIYYQFDQEEIAQGSHTYIKGYFEYERDGFGPVKETAEGVLQALEEIARNSFKPAEQYQANIDATFAYRDGKCCERVYQAIKALDGKDE
jgi:glycosyltransferase involved in cell wall biosynthesis